MGELTTHASGIANCLGQQERALERREPVVGEGWQIDVVEHRAGRGSELQLFEGCQLCRNTGDLIENSGFAHVDIDRSRFRSSVFIPVNSVVAGRAIQAS